MRIISSITATSGALAVALTLSAALQPAEAGRACDELGLPDNCVNSSDLKARLNLDDDGRDARLRLRNEDGDNAVILNAGSANVTNLFSNEEDESNGLVKAWAQDQCRRHDRRLLALQYRSGRDPTSSYRALRDRFHAARDRRQRATEIGDLGQRKPLPAAPAWHHRPSRKFG
jgi:hypothetical protein